MSVLPRPDSLSQQAGLRPRLTSERRLLAVTSDRHRLGIGCLTVCVTFVLPLTRHYDAPRVEHLDRRDPVPASALFPV